MILLVNWLNYLFLTHYGLILSFKGTKAFHLAKSGVAATNGRI